MIRGEGGVRGNKGGMDAVYVRGYDEVRDIAEIQPSFRVSPARTRDELPKKRRHCVYIL